MFQSTKIFKLFFLLSCFFSFVFAGFENYLKKVEGKSDIHKIKNVDFIYMINLDERPEKFEKSCQQLHFYDIYPCRFSAVNGWKLSLEAINEIGLKYKPGMKRFMANCYPPYNNTDDVNKQHRHEIFGTNKNYGYFCFQASRGVIGIILSHLSILQDAYNSGYEIIWVMEDDIDVIQNPHLISDMIEKLNAITRNNWDILFTDKDTKNRKGEYVPCFSYAKKPNFTPKNPDRFKMRKKRRKYFSQIGARFGAYSMVLSREGIRKILDFYKTYGPFLPYDMEYFLPNDIKMFCVNRDIVSTRVGAITDNAKPPPQ